MILCPRMNRAEHDEQGHCHRFVFRKTLAGRTG
jgi:hypothetical protein